MRSYSLFVIELKTYDMDVGVLRGGGNQLPVVAEAQVAQWALALGKGLHAHKLLQIPQRYKGIRAAGGEISARKGDAE